MEPNTILINRYKIHRKLNQKAGRQTFLAEDLQYSTENIDYSNLVVIKILQFNLDFNWDDLKLFKRETDIKPSNILIKKSSSRKIGRIYLVDFGSVQVTASKDSGTRTIVGSYGYMPLEQFGGQTTVSSDLYSLGMTLIYLITGTHPAELSQQNGRVKFDAKISNKLMKWLEKITQPYLDLRFDSARSAQNLLSSNKIENNDSSRDTWYLLLDKEYIIS